MQLYITALDINSNYITVGNTISDKDHDPDIRMCYIACTSTCGGGATIFGNGQFETSSDADATNAITSSTPNVQSGCGSVYFLPTRTSESKCSSQVTKKSANNYIKNFNNWMPVSEQTISFTFDAGTLINYLQYGTGFGIQDLHFILGRNSGTKQLDLIIGAIDVSGNHIYQIDGPGNLYVFEYCYPCPADCPGLSGRTTIMNKQSK
jgi:hypothetical protein